MIRKNAGITVCAMGLLLVAIAVFADTQARDVKVLKSDRVVDGKPLKSSNLRCWQYGQLLFEEIDVKLSDGALRKGGFHFDAGKNNPAQQLQILELGTALCLYREV